MHRLLPVAIVGAATAAASAQETDMRAAKAGMEAFDRGEYLKAETSLKAAALAPDGTIRDEVAFQMWQQVEPTLTGELPVGGLRPRRGKPDRAGEARDLAALRAATPRDAIPEIVRRARGTRIVILNEAHDSPRDRAFALEVARALRPLGYGYLAAETFDHSAGSDGKPAPVERLARDGFVRHSTGNYTQDPVFAGFVREALRLGYRPVAYEQTRAQQGKATERAGMIATRETAEARNLVAAVFRDHPHAKVLIYVGYSHATEEPIGEAGHTDRWMASRLKRLTGIDPLTIDQTTITDTSPATADAYAAASATISHPSILFAAGKPLVVGPYAGAVDLQVVHPPRRYEHGRPTWLAALGGRPVVIPPVLLPAHGERLIQAFAVDAPADAVPLDQVLVTAGTPAPSLMVPPGPYRLAVQDPG